MAEIATATASAALAGGIAAGTSGLPPQEVILWALAGGVASVWLSREADASLSWRWAASSLMQLGISAATGVALSALVLAVAPAHPLTAPLASAPRWSLAGLIAASAFKAGPPLWGLFMRLIGAAPKEGGPHA